ncbi:MAG: biliverdin-producing heme oxygenase [Pseudomonadota bacterium]|nr:biliverdin-producing heme oxygenase [Pseudomonadota bacterium]
MSVCLDNVTSRHADCVRIMCGEGRAIEASVTTRNLRAHLREATARAHDLLDDTMRAAAGWQTRDDYAAFLKIQYSARLSVEHWLSIYASPAIHPPAQTRLIAKDLTELGEELPDILDSLVFDPRQEASHDVALGIAWVLAGSSLGNKAILSEVRRIARAEGADAWPTRFLGDEAMLQFWKSLRREIEKPATQHQSDAASRAAGAVFDHFLSFAANNSGMNV